MNSARTYLLTYEDYQISASKLHTSAMPPRCFLARSARGERVRQRERRNLGVEPQLNQISYLPLKEGRWLNEMDVAQRRNVIVLGNELQKTCSPDAPPWERSCC
jgi:hypothetical protein